MALKYILPNFYNCYSHNVELFQTFAKTKNLCGIEGAFPFSIFYGAYNNISCENICLYDDMIPIIKDYGLLADMLILDCGNPLLEDFDYYDLYNTVILDEYAEKNNVYFSVSQEGLIKFLIERYPKINLILHQNYTRENTSQDIQKLIDNYSNIKGIITSSFNICSKVNNVFKIYLTPLHTCEECIHYKKCLSHDNQAILDYSQKSRFQNCVLRNLAHPNNIVERINFIKDKCDYILFDTVVCHNALAEYQLIEQVLEIMEE
jgi:hypothetical protein